MSITIKLDSPSRMITVHASGPISKKEWMDLFLGIKNHPDRIEGMDAIFDLSEQEVNISDHYLWAFAHRMMPHITKHFMVKWAFVSSREVTIEKIETFASFLVRNKNMKVKAFLDNQSAQSWIQTDKDERFGQPT